MLLEKVDEYHRQRTAHQCEAAGVDPDVLHPAAELVDHRHDIVAHVAEMQEPRQYRHGDHHLRPGLHVNSKKHEKRHEEMAKDDQHTNVPPRTILSLYIPECLLRDGSVPDQEILREMNVGVKHREGKK